eukprot:CAMPEP_0175765838 /NCGR_PEP_ID=MMETSP0097-20121207/69020_1 /TAXON_ID=311494 /ORGANISM="Alexandrium monilatum, Strain CCMP3105" /LENGTH=56 /DNA_ID=CAMNT_0017075733 /DNA_START=241 /DNA_END=411 /DNA_ORIENTATION=+
MSGSMSWATSRTAVIVAKFLSAMTGTLKRVGMMISDSDSVGASTRGALSGPSSPSR